MTSLACAPLSDGRLQLFFTNERDQCFTTWKVAADRNANWSRWRSVSETVGFGALCQDGRTQLWTVDGSKTCWKTSAESNSGWSAWRSFDLPPVGRWGVRRTIAVPTQEGGRRVFMLSGDGRIWTKSRPSDQIDSPWGQWNEMSVPLLTGGRFLPVADMAVGGHPDGNFSIWVITDGRAPEGFQFKMWADIYVLNVSVPSWESVDIWGRVGSIDVAPMSDSRLMMWAAATAHDKFLYAKQLHTQGPLQSFQYAQDALRPNGAFFAKQLVLGQLSDGGLTVWALGGQLEPKIISKWQMDADPEGEWTSWDFFPLPDFEWEDPTEGPGSEGTVHEDDM